MTERGVRIISLEANKIYEQIEKNGEETGFILPEKPKTQKDKKQAFQYYRLFKNVLDYSLDAIELEDAYTKICRKKFSFQDEHGYDYTLAVVNLKFNYTHPLKDLRQLRQYFGRWWL